MTASCAGNAWAACSLPPRCLPFLSINVGLRLRPGMPVYTAGLTSTAAVSISDWASENIIDPLGY